MPVNGTKNGQAREHYSTKKISHTLVDEITSALKKVDAYGSVEIYVQNSAVTQITTRSIKKTDRVSA
jgi:hypothetical protein